MNLHFSGAVRSPDFILGKTNVQDWLKDVENTQVPWLEARSERVIFSIPRNMVINYKEDARNIEGALTEWNEIYEKDFYDCASNTKTTIYQSLSNRIHDANIRKR